MNTKQGDSMPYLKEAKKFLVFSAHPDDADFMCGGTAADLTRRGKEVVYCVVADGGAGVHKRKLSWRKLVQLRQKEQEAAASLLGVRKVYFLGRKDGEVENTKALRRKMVGIIRKVKPDVILSQDPANLLFSNFSLFHRDHRMTAEAVFDAVYPAAGSAAFFPDLLQRGLRPHQIQAMWFYGTDKPDVFVDIAHTIEKKIQALRRHESQIRDMKKLGPRVREHARKIARLSKKSMKYAEAFRVISF